LGDCLAIVAAETERIAEQAASLIRVEYEILPAIFDPEEAMRESAPPVHEKGNLLSHHRVRKGDLAQGMAESEVIVEGRYTTPFVEHAYLETEVALAIPNPDGTITIRGSIQLPFSARRAVSDALGIGLSSVRVVPATIGGSFGGKDDSVSELCCHAALLARVTGRPVRIANSREESFLASYKRHPCILKYRVGARKDGTLLALQASVIADAGAYASLSPFIVWRAAVHAAGPYRIPHVSVDTYAVYTNNTYTGAMRGFGSPQVHFAVESLLDELADTLGMDPLEVRLRNALEAGSTTATGQLLEESVGLKETLRAARAASRWDEKRFCSAPVGVARRRGIGVACGYHGVSLGAEGVDAVAAQVQVTQDGQVLIMTGLTDVGAGVKTAYAQIAAQELGVSLDSVQVLEVDTSAIADSGPTVASRATTMGGMAVAKACALVKGNLARVAGASLGEHPDALVFADAVIRCSHDPAKCIPFNDAALTAYQQGTSLLAASWHEAPPTTWDEELAQGNAYFAYHFGTQIAEVDVDIETGQVQVLNIVAAHDVGKAINPEAVRGQIFGGVVMGVGFALLEDFRIHQGLSETLSFDEYSLPTALDVPEIVPIIVEDPCSRGPHGAKGTGEPTTLPTAPAILNAIFNATGRRIRDLPANLERVLLGRALSKHDRSSPTVGA